MNGEPARAVVRSVVVLIVWLALLAGATPSHAARYALSVGDGRQEVRFHSKAPIESFDGVTDQVTGWIEVQLDALGDGARWHIEVDLTGLDTGIGLRDQHMRENHLHTAEFPVAVFEGTMAELKPGGALLVDESIDIELAGILRLHGIARERTIACRVTRRREGALEFLDIRAEFLVRLADHGIPRPKFLMLKLAEDQRVEVRLRADEITRETR